LALPRDGAEVSDFNWLKKLFGQQLPYCFPKRFRTAAQTCLKGDESRAWPPILQTHQRRQLSILTAPHGVQAPSPRLQIT
jgi:hypothetical protein